MNKTNYKKKSCLYVCEVDLHVIFHNVSAYL